MMKQGIRNLFYTLLLGLFLSACGGGGGGGSPLPATPTNIQVANFDGYTRLQWNPVANATSYNVYWSTRRGVNKTNSNKISYSQNTVSHGGLLNGRTYYYVVSAVNSAGESGVSSEVTGTPQLAIGFDDPLFIHQWHLANTGQNGGTQAQDINVEPVWNCVDSSCRGEGIRIAVVDGGIESGHPDLAANFLVQLSYNYYTNLNDPAPQSTSDYHGTGVAGILASRDQNGVGGRGVAPQAQLVGYNLLNYQTLANEADAMTRGGSGIHISSNSWGPNDNGDLHESSLAWRSAIDTGLTTGRNGLGTIYVWAGGNGDMVGDNSNYDGQANHYGVIAVGAVTNTGVKASYSESGANILVSAPGGEFCDSHAITTTDLTGNSGRNKLGSNDYPDRDYTRCMNGTSAATPVVSGTVALMLQANPNLGWRDVRYILATTASQNDAAGPGWFQNNGTPQHWLNHKYGFGMVNAEAAVNAAKNWTNLVAEKTYSVSSNPAEFPIAIPDNTGASVSNDISVAGSGINKIEFVEIIFNASNHTYSGDLEVTLTRTLPNGAISVLAVTHACTARDFNNNIIGAACAASHDNWVFSSVHHLDEPADGTWTLTVKDGASVDIGFFKSWGLKFYGH